MDFFEGIGKLRAYRKLWARLMRERYGATKPEAMKIRMMTSSTTTALTLQQPLNNIGRLTIMATACALGGAGDAMTTPLYDEAHALPAQEAHTVGVTVITHALREAGMEVIFTGLKQTPDMVASAAIQEDVDVVGVSSLLAAHLRHLPRLAELLRENGGRDMLLIAGGVVPEEDIPALHAAGVQRVFTMGSDTRDIIAYLNEWWAARNAEDDRP